jgi:virginiamycin B lyase
MQAHAKVCLVSVVLMTLSACAGEAVDEARKPPPRTMGSGGNSGYTQYGYAGGFGKGGTSPSLAGSGGYAGSSGAAGGGVGGGGASNGGASGSGTAYAGSGGGTALATAGTSSGTNCPSLTLARMPDGKCVPRVAEFDVARKPTNIVTDPDGQIWIDDDAANQFLQLDKDGKITRRVDCDSGSSIRTLVGGKGDALFWYTDAQAKQLIKVTKESDKASVTYLGFTASAAVRGANDELFLAEWGKAIYRVVPEQPSPLQWQASPTDVLVVDPDNHVWTSQGSALAKLTPGEGVKIFDLGSSYAGGLCMGPDMALWFSDGFADQLVRVGLDGRLLGTINLPTTTGPARIITGPDKALWFAEQGKLKIGRFDPKTGELTHYPLPTSGVMPRALTVGSDKNIWFTEADRKVGRLIPDPIVP